MLLQVGGVKKEVTMQYPKLKNVMLSLSLLLAVNLAHAGLVSEEVVADTIATEDGSPASAPEMPVADEGDEIVLVRKKPPTHRVALPGRKVIVREVVQSDDSVTMVDAAPQAAPAPKREGVGGRIDGAIDRKVEDVRKTMEDSLIRAVEGIKIKVGDDAKAEPAPATAAVAVAAAPAAGTTAVAVVHDSVASAAAAEDKAYAALDTEPVGKSDAEAEEEGALEGSLSVFPLIGLSMMSAENYNIDSRYTAGFGLEVDIGSGLAFVGTYSYSQYDVKLANQNPFYGYYQGYNPNQLNNLNSLEYNQNVISTGMRYYFLPKSSRYRFFVGAGTGFNKGYLNYKQNYLNQYAGVSQANNGSLQDYEVTSLLGHLEIGGEVQLSKAIAIGAMTRYHTVLTSRENTPINNYAFLGAPMGPTSAVDHKQLVGGSIRDSGFLSMAATLKVTF